MQCVNHPEVMASAFCQNCGKALCPACTERTPAGQVFCANCRAAAASGFAGQPGIPPAAPYAPPMPPPAGVPNPGLAAFLGLIPGVGAMYNGQFFKGMVHVIIFAVLVTLTDRYDIVGIFIAAWVFYQSFEAFHTARARRDGLPLPDPFGINELGSWLNFGTHPTHPASAPTSAQAGPQAGQQPGAPTAAPTASYPYSPANPAQQSADAPPYAEPYTGAPSSGGWTDPYAGGYPPGPPPLLRRNAPVGAVVLIALGILFLLQSMGFVEHLMRFAWPLLLIGLGIWLILSRTGIGGPRS